MEARLVLSTFVVNTLIDQIDPPGSATISVRDAIAKATANPGADTIDVPAGNYKLAKGELIIADGSGALMIQSVGGLATFDGQAKSPDVFDVNDVFNNVSLSGLSITGASLGGPLDAAVYNYAGTLNLTDCTISGNPGFGLVDTENHGTGATANVTLNGVTVSKNGQGVDVIAPMSIVNSTITGNAGDGLNVAHAISLYDSTITNNAGFGINASEQVTLGNSIVSGNHSSGQITEDVLAGPFASKGGNVVGNINQTGGWIGTDQTGTAADPVDPFLAPLGNYGGLTQTQPPLGGGLCTGRRAAFRDCTRGRHRSTRIASRQQRHGR